jgi:hypothetical protein
MIRYVALLILSAFIVGLACISGGQAAAAPQQREFGYVQNFIADPDSRTGPQIKRISRVVNQATQQITITGVNFGTHSPYDGDTPYLWTIDLNGNWRAGCYDSAPCGTWLNVTSWTDTQIVIAAFDGPSHGVPKKHDALIFIVYNPVTLQGPSVKVVTVR